MAEGLLNSMFDSKYIAKSAGIKAKKVNPFAVEVMREIGIDISKNYSKTINEFKNKEFDIVITVCNNVKETCPFFPGKKIIHKSFPNPENFIGDNKVQILKFRKVKSSPA
jgi:arsenate reductase